MGNETKNEILKRDLINLIPDEMKGFKRTIRKCSFSDSELKIFILKFKKGEL